MIKRIISTETIEVPQEPPWMTAKELEDKCCYPVEPVPACEVAVSPWRGYSSDEVIEELGLKLDADGFDEDGYYVDLRLISGPNGCGTQEIRQIVKGYNCCLTVPQLEWDFDNSSVIISPDSHAYVFVLGGQLPLYVELRGEGFYLDAEHTFRDGTVNSHMITIYTKWNACGPCVIYINDGCSAVSGEVASTLGKWVDVGWFDWEEIGFGVVDSDAQSGGYTFTAWVTLGHFRYTQGWSLQGRTDLPGACNPPAIGGPAVIKPYPDRSTCASTYTQPQSLPAWWARIPGYSDGNNISCGWGGYFNRCHNIFVEEWVC